jgi:hypothetical protein
MQMVVRKNKFIEILIMIAVVLAITGAPGLCAGITEKDGPAEAVALEKQDARQLKVAGDRSIVVYYFHTTNRCYSCTQLEKMTYLAVADGFEKELADGRVKFASINVEQDENKHFIKDYKLYTKSVIISDVAKGKEMRWKNLQKVWELLRDDEVFKDYVQEEVRLYLRGE